MISQVYSMVLLLHEKFLGLASPLLSSQQQIDLFHIPKFGFSWTAQAPHAAAFLISRAHLEEESILLETVPPPPPPSSLCEDTLQLEAEGS